MRRFASAVLAAALSALVLVPAFAQDARITQDRAVEIARGFKAAAGFPAGELIHAFAITRNGRLIWDVEFRAGNTEYEFYIDALTGEIVGFEMERHNLPPGAPHPRFSSRTSPTHPLNVSAAQALEIAARLVGGGNVDESLMEIGLGFYHGRSVHQISMASDGRRFQVFVATDTGEVLRLRSR